MSAETIGIVGTGRMGTAIAKRLIEQGFTVHVWNRSAEKTTAAVDAGAQAAASLKELSRQASVIISSLTDFAALWQVYCGEGGVLETDVSGKLFIEMSTILPAEQSKLADAVAGKGAAYLECPVGGTVGPALKGQLLGFAGGEQSAWQRGEPVLTHLCKRVEYIGPSGSGAAMKLAVNLPLALYWNVLGEALHLIGGLDLPGERIASLLADSSAGPNVLKNRMQVVADTLDGTDQPGTFDIDGLRKDLALSITWAEQQGHKMPLSKVALGTYDAAQRGGLGRFDGATLARFVRSES